VPLATSSVSLARELPITRCGSVQLSGTRLACDLADSITAPPSPSSECTKSLVAPSRLRVQNSAHAPYAGGACLSDSDAKSSQSDEYQMRQPP
jgi:hypothetical protein